MSEVKSLSNLKIMSGANWTLDGMTRNGNWQEEANRGFMTSIRDK